MLKWYTPTLNADVVAAVDRLHGLMHEAKQIRSVIDGCYGLSRLGARDIESRDRQNFQQSDMESNLDIRFRDLFVSNL